MARPPSITIHHVREVRDAIRIGLTQEQAAAYIGVGERTFYRWMRRGLREPDTIYGQFRQAVKRGEAQSVAYEMANIRRAARDGDWKASAWLLERRHGFTRTVAILNRAKGEEDAQPIRSVEEYRELVERVMTTGQIAALAPAGLIVSEDE